ncbi:MAG: sugar phosphate isomerase/epimerase [Ruminococcaceae bacterium]|nr:sugar phosphate isomerase/epimerase [Oscillospiraceae bacterium]
MKKFKIGLQLYSVRDHMEKDMDATLRAVKEMGYDYVEFAGYFGKTAEEVKTLLDKYELTCVSVHQNPDIFDKEGQAAVDYQKKIGVKYSAVPWYALENFTENYEGSIELFKKTAKLLNENGIELLYHNHEFEFTKINGEYIIDKIYSDFEGINPEFDTCWIRYAGENPADYLRKYKGRIRLVHLKDFVADKLACGPVYELIGNKDHKPSREDNGFKFRPVGYGMQDFDEILKACEEIDAELLIVEQDQWYENDSLEEAKKSRNYLKDTFGI